CGAEPALIDLAKRCLSFKPSDRHADANALAAEVSALRAEAEQRARDAEMQRARAEVRAAEQRKRRKVQLALAASLLVLLGLASGGIAWADRQLTKRRIEAAANRQAVEFALDRAEAALRKDNPIYGEIDAALTQVEHRLPAQGEDAVRARFEGLKKDRRM